MPSGGGEKRNVSLMGLKNNNKWGMSFSLQT
jgi:hypothetical protein